MYSKRTRPGFEFAVKLFQKFTHPSMFLEAVAAGAPGASDAALAAAGDVRQADVDWARREGLASDEREELRRLQCENRRLEPEREILKRPRLFRP